MNGFWIRAPNALDAHASATTQVRSDTITAFDEVDGGWARTGEGREARRAGLAWRRPYIRRGTLTNVMLHFQVAGSQISAPDACGPLATVGAT